MADLVTKYNGSADLHSSLPSINNCFRHQFLLYSNVLSFFIIDLLFRISVLFEIFCFRYLRTTIP